MTMPLYLKSSFLLIFISFFAQAQIQPQKELKPDYIHILYADHATTNAKYPGKQLLSGNVKIEHNGATLICDKAIVDKTTNTAIAVGKVHLMQGDTLEMKAGFLKYDGNKSFAEAFDKVFLKDPKMSLTTDTLFFDRKKQEAYYVSGGVIVDSINKLRSEQGKYFLEKKLFRFKHNVHIDNPDYQLDSYQLDYYADSGVSNFYGPTKIYNPQSYIYAEKGHYDSKKKISWFVKNAFIKHKHTTIKGDSLYYDQKNAFATGNKNVVLHDSINKTWIFTDAAQRWIN
ncbi:MAG TPA: OstA-like protein, partial [Flavobacteriales bacterium]|nr:OstA-like protein [Flavobacteriales bacterium]